MTCLAEMSCRAHAHDHVQQIVALRDKSSWALLIWRPTPIEDWLPQPSASMAANSLSGTEKHHVKRPSSETLFAPMTSLRMAEHTWPCDELLPVCKESAKRSNCSLQTHTDGCSTQSLRDANLPSSKTPANRQHPLHHQPQLPNPKYQARCATEAVPPSATTPL